MLIAPSPVSMDQYGISPNCVKVQPSSPL